VVGLSAELPLGTIKAVFVFTFATLPVDGVRIILCPAVEEITLSSILM